MAYYDQNGFLCLFLFNISKKIIKYMPQNQEPIKYYVTVGQTASHKCLVMYVNTLKQSCYTKRKVVTLELKFYLVLEGLQPSSANVH